MSLTITTTTTTATARVKMAPPSPMYAHPTFKFAHDTAVEIKSSKTREERRTVDTGRRTSVQWHDSLDSEDGERCEERRGSKDTMRRKSVVKADNEGFKKHRGGVHSKREVLVSKG
jgi:hypothetical protein